MARMEFEALDDQGYIRECTDMAGVPGWVLFDCDGNALLASTQRCDLFFEAVRCEMQVVLLNCA